MTCSHGGSAPVCHLQEQLLAFTKGNKKINVGIKLDTGNWGWVWGKQQKERVLLCPICKGISKFDFIASKLPWFGLVVLALVTIVVDTERVFEGWQLIIVSGIGIFGFMVMIKPDLFYDYKLELLDATEEDVIK